MMIENPKKIGRFKYFIIQLFNWLGIDLFEENRKLQERVLQLENEQTELKKQIGGKELQAINERKLPDGFKRSHNNLLTAPDGTKYCWNCYNKPDGELRVLDGDEYYVYCKDCKRNTRLREYSPPRKTYDDGDNAGFGFSR